MNMIGQITEVDGVLVKPSWFVDKIEPYKSLEWRYSIVIKLLNALNKSD